MLCDACFHASDHEGHDVYFHRTSPGGCCDCGDTEAWRVEGCCPLHRPRGFGDTASAFADNANANTNSHGSDENNGNCTTPHYTDMNMKGIAKSFSALSEESFDFEAVKASLRGRADGDLCIREMLPPKLAAALGVVIGAAVQTAIQAIDGAAIGADPVQWTRRWADQIRRLEDKCANDEEYIMTPHRSYVTSVGNAMKLDFPNKFKLHLRLHNDDVHTYDEVIEALYSYNAPGGSMDDETDTSRGIVRNKEEANNLTTHVDTDGQVIARAYSTMEGAKAGYERLKGCGLHCSVVSSPQLDLELRAKQLLSWLSDIAAAHPAVAALVVHALVDVTEGSDPIGGAYVWANSRMIPPWAFTYGYLRSARLSIHEEGEQQGMEIPGWRRRMNVFPPNLKSSFLTREELRHLHKLGLASVNEISSPKKGVDLNFYSNVPYVLPSERFRKSPHSLWGIMPSPFTSPKRFTHPFLYRDNMNSSQSYVLSENLIVLETDLRKQQEAEMLLNDGCTHALLGLHMISGVGLVDVEDDDDGGPAMKPTAEEWGQLLSIASYRAPVSPMLLMLLLDP